MTDLVCFRVCHFGQLVTYVRADLSRHYLQMIADNGHPNCFRKPLGIFPKNRQKQARIGSAGWRKELELK